MGYGVWREEGFAGWELSCTLSVNSPLNLRSCSLIAELRLSAFDSELPADSFPHFSATRGQLAVVAAKKDERLARK
jgi:hypothetical protein